MARKSETLTIDFASLTPQDLADVRLIAEQGGMTPELWPMVDLTNPPVQVLTGLVYVVMRKTEPRITPARCIRIAQAALGAGSGR